MKTRKFLWALLPVAAVLLMTACGGDTDDVTPTPTPNPVTPGTENVVKSVPYSVTVKTADVTRTSVGNDDITLRFEATDKLYVQNTKGTVYGCLELKSGENQTSATFAGTVNYTGTKPADTDQLTATLVGSANLLDMIGTDGKVKGDAYISIPATPCETMSDAVSKYSWIRGTGTYGEANFTLVQRTAFMMFSVTIEDGTAGNVSVPVKITNGSDTYSFSQTTTGTQFDAYISFVLPFEEGKKIAGDASMCVANVGDDDESIRIGTGTNVTLAGGNVYPVTRTKDFVRLWANGPLWSTKNVGASSVTDYGGYYQWGSTTDVTSTEYSLAWNDTYPYWKSGNTNNSNNITVKLTKYVTAAAYWGGDEGTTHDNKTQLDNGDDPAYAVLPEGTWRMPTRVQLENLVSNTTNAWTTGSVNGRTFTGKGSYTGKAIFLPAGDYRNGNTYNDGGPGSTGYYWSATVSDPCYNGYGLNFTLSTCGNSGSSRRYDARNIRPVRTN
ncbi:MAG: hypothetical protein IJV38_13790 [Prevotella sp.]|nr:hypothetical protein [Prevotella sp.]